VTQLLSGTVSPEPARRVVDGVLYVGPVPTWVVRLVAASRAVGVVVPRSIEWMSRRTRTLRGDCRPSSRIIRIFPFSVDESTQVDGGPSVDASGEIDVGPVRMSAERGTHDQVITLAHELAHLVHVRHGREHRALLARILDAFDAGDDRRRVSDSSASMSTRDH